jgi:ribonucleoside-diphosphate reductase alpha chain
MTTKLPAARAKATAGKRNAAGPSSTVAHEPLSDTARRVLAARYLRRDATGAVSESPDELFERVARAVAHAELLLGNAAAAAHWERRFHEALAARDFLPNSPTLMNAGTPLGQLAACFVLPVADTMEGIFDSLRAMALVQRTGGGTGFSFSRLRPRGARLHTTGGEASGPVSFLRVFDAATEHIRLGGRRRGANMAVLSVEHPDVLEFVDAKRDGRSLGNFNLSVAVPDAFMQAVERGDTYALHHAGSAALSRHLAAREVFERIVDAAWTSGDPGLLFVDAVERDNPTPKLGPLQSTNPCGEVPLLPWESCVLGSINLAHMVGADGADIDWQRLRHTVHLGVRFLDDVIEASREPLPEIAAATRATRKIGLGVMGFAELLIRLGVSYADAAAESWAERVAAFLAAEAHAASQALAETRGVFPQWEASVHAERGAPRRNASCVSIAPTGTLSLIAATTGGIEPLFALAYRRAHTLGGGPLVELNPVFARMVEQLGVDAARVRAEVEESGTLARVAGVPEALRRLFVTALELSPAQHLRIQHAFQRHTDNAVAKTINLPETATRADVAAIYRQAWALRLKGITVYRYGAKDNQVLTLGTGEDGAARELFTRCDPGACRL